MRTVTRYQSENGKLWETPKEALLADLEVKFRRWYDSNPIHGDCDECDYPIEPETVFKWCITNGVIIPGVIEIDSLEPKAIISNPSLAKLPLV